MLQMNCTAHSNPGPAYSWTGPDNTNVGNRSVLTFQAAGFEQEGQYVCVASNNQGNTTMKFTVDVHGGFNVFNLSASESASLPYLTKLVFFL